nr:hypothetical protein [Tanacetum cinerariifolium]
MRKKIGELHVMLIEYEKGLPKKAATPQVMAIHGGRIQKANKKSQNAKGKGKGKGKGKDKSYVPKPKNHKPIAKEHPTKNNACHHCKEVGYWKRNCHVYLAELMKNKKQVGFASSSCIFKIELFSFPNKSWVYDTGCVSRNDVLYFNDIPSNGIYEIDMSNSVPNVNSIYNVSNKRVKQNSDSSYLWHCRLAHISKKRIGKLQHDGLLKSTNDELFDQCVSCLSGKMTRKSFPHHPERVTGLLGLIHTDVFKNEVENQLGKTIKALRSNRGGEYISQEFKDYLKACGIVQQLTPPYTPQHNRMSKKRNHTFLDMADAPILNMVPTKEVDKTPYELWFRKVPNLSYLKVWGCEPFVKRDTITNFNKDPLKVSGRVGDLEEIQDEDTSPSKITSEIPIEVEGFEPPHEEEAPVRRSERPHRAPNRLCLNVEVEEHNLRDLNETTNYKAAMLDTKSNKWLDAINAEIKWIFKKKTAMNGNVHTYKARLVAKGFTQTYGVDYEETFSLVADIRAIRILIAIDAFYDYEIWKMDVKTTFLNGYLDKGIYMVQPEGFIDPKHPMKVCKLQRSIYGLKKASRSWNKRFDEEIKKFGFTQNLDEPCVYQKASGSNVTFLILYVDDIIAIGNHIPSLQSVKEYLGKCFVMKDLGEATFILGIKIYRDRSRRLIGLSQSAYMDKILKRYRIDNSKRGYILMQERLDLNKTQDASTPGEVKRMQNVPYASVVGSIMYAVRCTRPDVAFVQNITSLFQQNPGELHWTAVKIILKYLRNTKDMFLVYGENPEAKLRVDCYCDARFETNRDDTKSQTRYIFILNGGIVDWKSSKQSTTAMSAT